MTRFPNFWRLLTGQDPTPDPRSEAFSDYAAALVRRDTRKQHQAWLKLRDATCGQLKREIGR